ncbi:MAG: AMIN domain-containing protein [Rhodobacteraceae bacterium]|nr:AMIN domain-containing protein [Paracoccaceae bacterium]
MTPGINLVLSAALRNYNQFLHPVGYSKNQIDLWERGWAVTFSKACRAIILLLFVAAPGVAQDLQALARVDANKSAITTQGTGDVEVRLTLSQPVPYRLFTLADPARLVMDFKEIDWTGFDQAKVLQSDQVTSVRYGIFRPGWSRMVVQLVGPAVVQQAEMKTNLLRGTAELLVVLSSSSRDEFKSTGDQLFGQEWELPIKQSTIIPKKRQIGDRPLVVVIDPGHGGIDPGAEHDGYLEKELVLQFCRELKDALVLSGRYKVKLTRTGDEFTSLPDRITLARQNGADVFLSIHADALSEGSATGTTVYTLSDKASDSSAEELARTHDRGDLLAGVDLRQQDDEIAEVLMDMARLETAVRSELLAEMLVGGIGQSVGRIRKRPHLSAGFTVLKAPDIPSVLIELGFMSNRSDLSNLLTLAWREKAVRGILLALDSWAVEDAAQARLLRQ